MNSLNLPRPAVLFLGILLFGSGALALYLVAARGSGQAVHIGDRELVVNTASPSVAGPVLVFDLVPHDFGTMIEGEQVKFRFPFRNLGQGDLVVRHVRFTCRCAGAATSVPNVAPGGTGYVETWFHSSPGPVSAKIYVEANDATGIHQLTVSGKIEARFALSSSVIDLGSVPPNGKAAARFTIRNIVSSSDSMITPEGIKFTSSSPALTVRPVASPPQQPGPDRPDALEFEIVLQPGSAAQGPGAALLLIDIPYAGQELRRHVDVTYTVAGVITVRPESGFFSFVRDNGGRTATVELIAGKGKPFRVTDVNCNLDCVEMQVETLEPETCYRVTAALSETSPAASVKGQVTIRTTDEYQGAIVLPLRFVVLDRPAPGDAKN